MILGTAGHIDHGKTALIKALTGVDTDRLPEERRRGITIELGFAPLRLDGAIVLGVVDVPGHEAFVRTMVAGATGVDLALLVVAADEGVMPQTREHVAILTLLGVRAGVVALTKCDLVDAEWLELVADDVRSLVADSPLAGAEIVATSAAAGTGLDELRRAIDEAARSLPARDAEDLFRMPIDRAFTLKGTGTVVTGTVWSGSLTRDGAVRVLPNGVVTRARGIQSHGAQLEQVKAGARAAIALAGVGLDDVTRGSVLVAHESWRPTRSLRAEVALLDEAAGAVGPRTQMRLHLGTSDVGARIVTAGGTLSKGNRRPARVLLDEAVVARTGDRFILRRASPARTVGGGVVVDPLPPHRRSRPLAATGAATPAPTELLVRLLAEAGGHGVERAALALRLGVAPSAAEAIVASLDGRALALGGRVYDARALEEGCERLLSLVDRSHARAPLDAGASLQATRAQLRVGPDLTDEVVRVAVGRRQVEVEGGLIRRAGWAPRPSPTELAVLERVQEVLRDAGREPPSVAELCEAHGPAVPALLRFLERAGDVVQVEPERFYARGVLADVQNLLQTALVAGRAYTPAELRDVLGVSRKYLIPLLEYCDRMGVTERRSSGRALRGT